MLNPETNTPSLVSIIKRTPIYDISTPNSKPPRAGTAMDDDGGVDGVAVVRIAAGVDGVVWLMIRGVDDGCRGDDVGCRGDDGGVVGSFAGK
ncbi:hypothetical protein Tco_0624262 [Tanacetum coccineum]|uniref:Uncharacterized protein n=1 Tax=Tanacetum coccineum TaxID=301880 RepID=A0ABQ4WDG1_9ASTR